MRFAMMAFLYFSLFTVPDPEREKEANSHESRSLDFEEALDFGHLEDEDEEDHKTKDETTLTFQNLLLTTTTTTTRRPRQVKADKLSFDRLMTSPDSSRSNDILRRLDGDRRNDDVIRRSDDVIEEKEDNRDDGFHGQQHFVYLPRDELVPRFDEPEAPSFGIGFDEWLKVPISTTSLFVAILP